MGLFDSIAGQVSGALSNSGQGNSGGLMDVVVGLINNPETGGIQGLISTLKERGLGDAVSSWIGTGTNLPVSGEQIQAALGNEQLQAIARQMGLSSDDASNGLANLLPQVMDKLTPNGEVPQDGMLGQGLALLKGFGG